MTTKSKNKRVVYTECCGVLYQYINGECDGWSPFSKNWTACNNIRYPKERTITYKQARKMFPEAFK